jgi:hypothetical protein
MLLLLNYIWRTIFAFGRPVISVYVKKLICCFDSPDNLSGLKQTSHTETKKKGALLLFRVQTHTYIQSQRRIL